MNPAHYHDDELQLHELEIQLHEHELHELQLLHVDSVPLDLPNPPPPDFRTKIFDTRTR